MQSAHRDQCHTTSIPISGKRRGRTENCAGIVIRKPKGLRGNRPQKDHKKGWLRLAGELGEMDQSSARAWEGTGTCKFHYMITDIIADQTGTQEKEHSFHLRGDFGGTDCCWRLSQGVDACDLRLQVRGIQPLASTGVQHVEAIVSNTNA